MVQTLDARSVTNLTTRDGRGPRLAWIVPVVCGVVAFRIAAYLWPSPFVSIPESLALPLGGLGLFFLACGIWAWRARPSAATRAFLIYGTGMGLHWGGPIGAPWPALEWALLTVYVAATAAGDGAFLDLALRCPSGEGPPARAASAIYLLAAALLVAAPLAPLLPRRTVEAALGLLFLAFLLVSLVAVIVFVFRWIRATPALRHQLGLHGIVGALIVSVVANQLGEAGVLPGLPEAWGLSYALVPLALARALTRPQD